MTISYGRTKVLILVMTYPNPSYSYIETICTAGVTEEGDWVRLYPIDYRYLDQDKRFRKYQWIEIELGPSGNSNDNRKESRQPKLDTLKMLGEPIPTSNNWAQRKEIISKLSVNSVKVLRSQYEQERVSLGVVKPLKVIDISIQKVTQNWRPNQEHSLRQFRLFGQQPKPLTKIPYKFSYVFLCDDSHSPHNAMIEDWELGVLFLKEKDRLGCDERAAESVKRKYFDEICGPSKDTHFYMGTTFPYNSWVVLGVFYPKKESPIKTTRKEEEQLSIF